MGLNSIVWVVGRGNTRYEVVAKSSPVRHGDWIVMDRNGAMLSVSPSKLKEKGGE